MGGGLGAKPLGSKAMLKKIIILLLFATIYFSCSTSKFLNYYAYRSPIDSLTKAEQDFITLERTRCFGDCPTYKLLILANGNSWISIPSKNFNDTSYTLISLPKIDSQKVQYLFNFSKNIGFYNLYSRYIDSCDYLVTDYPSAITSLKANDKIKIVTHYLGCMDTTLALHNLILFEEAIDSIANTKNYVPMNFGIMGSTVLRNVYADSTKK